MKRRSKVLAAATLILLLAILVFPALDWGGWNFQLPVIEGTVARREKPALIATASAPMAPGIADRRLSGTRELRPTSNATIPISAPSTKKQRSPKDPEAAPPYWCFRTYYPGLPWMMNNDERNTGNAARSDSDYVWNGERSLRMDIEPIRDRQKSSIRVLGAQSNVLWQAIRADPFRGKRVAFRPTLRVTYGARLTAFLRSWDGVTGAPQLATDRTDLAKTPTVIWTGIWGNPRLLLDVPMDAKVIYYGIVQAGTLPVWIDHVEFTSDPFPESLDTSSYAGQYLERLPPIPIDPNWIWKKPENLDFETIYPDENAEPPEDTPPLPC